MKYQQENMEVLADKMEGVASELFYIHDQSRLYELFDNPYDVGRVEDIHDAGCHLQALAHRLRRKAAGAKLVTVATKQDFFSTTKEDV